MEGATPGPPGQARGAWRRDPAWLLVLLAVVPGLRVLGDPLHRFVGLPGGEAPGHIWVQWLLRQALVHRHSLFVHPDAIGEGPLQVYPIDLLFRLPAGLLGGLIGDPAAFTVAALGAVALIGVGTALLARELGVGVWPSVLSGALVAVHPTVLGFLATRVDSLMIGWALVCAVAWLRLLRAPTRHRAVGLGVALGLLPAASLNLSFLAAHVLLPWGLVAAWRGGRPLRRSLLLAGMISGVMGGLLAATGLQVEEGGRLSSQPDVAGRTLVQWASPAELASNRAIALRRLALHQVRSEDVVPWFSDVPGARLALDSGSIPLLDCYAFSSGGYPGWLLLLLASLGVLRDPRRALPWMGLSLLLAGLGFGHGLSHMEPLPWSRGEGLLVLAPGNLLGRLPVWENFRNYAIFTAMATIPAAIVAGRAIRVRQGQRWLVLGLLLAWCAEVQLLAPVPLVLPVADSRISPELVTLLQGGRGPLATLPHGKEIQAFIAPYHHKPLDIAWNRTGWERSGVVYAAWKAIEDETDPCAALQEAGGDTLLLLPGLLSPTVVAQATAALHHWVGPPTWSGPEGEVWRCPPASAAPSG